MTGPKTLPRERAERFHRARIDRAGSPRDGMAGAWCWLLAELRKACAERLSAEQLNGATRPDIDPSRSAPATRTLRQPTRRGGFPDGPSRLAGRVSESKSHR